MTSADKDHIPLLQNKIWRYFQRLEQVKEKLNKVMQIAEICKKYEHEGDESFLKDIEDDSETVDYENLDGAMIVRKLKII